MYTGQGPPQQAARLRSPDFGQGNCLVMRMGAVLCSLSSEAGGTLALFVCQSWCSPAGILGAQEKRIRPKIITKISIAYFITRRQDRLRMLSLPYRLLMPLIHLPTFPKLAQSLFKPQGNCTAKSPRCRVHEAPYPRGDQLLPYSQAR